MLKRRYIAGMLLVILGLVTVISVTIAPSLIAEEDSGKLRKQIPFKGMILSYQIYCPAHSPPMFRRMIIFFGDPTDPYLNARDSGDLPDDPNDDRVFQMDKETRKIFSHETYSEPLLPTNLHIGDEVTIYWDFTYTIIGSQRMSAMGKRVDAWIVELGAYTRYYEKKTGIWLGGEYDWWDNDTQYSYTVHLVSTNVPLCGIEKD